MLKSIYIIYFVLSLSLSLSLKSLLGFYQYVNLYNLFFDVRFGAFDLGYGLRCYLEDFIFELDSWFLLKIFFFPSSYGHCSLLCM